MADVKFKHPIYLKLGPDGALYKQEWGTQWADNTDATLVGLEAAR
jgi:hypothetical protein